MSPHERVKAQDFLNQLLTERDLLVLLSIIACAGFCATTVIHFALPAANVEFFIGILTIAPLSAIVHFCSEDLAFRVQDGGYGVVAGLVGFIFRYGLMLDQHDEP
jgi:hypothetical protein